MFNNSVYSNEYTVVDCFKKSKVSLDFKPDSLLKNEVFSGQKIWRKISLEDKENKIIFNSNSKCLEVTLFEIIKFGVLNLKLNVFSSDDFNSVKNTRIDDKQFLKLISLKDTSIIKVFDANGNETNEVLINNRYLYGQDVKSYLLKENWIINSKTGVLEKYVIGLAPLVYDSKLKKVIPLFWIYYKEWKKLFESFNVYNNRVNNEISYDDVFMNKYFNSVVFKQDNLFNRDLNSIYKGQNIDFESEKIKENIKIMEEDLFQH